MKDNLRYIAEFTAPQNKKQIRHFLGKVNFYSKYIPNTTISLDPTLNLLSSQLIVKKAFQTIKNLSFSAPILAIFDREAPSFIYTDASIKGIGAIPKQTQKVWRNQTSGVLYKEVECIAKKATFF